MKLKKKIGIAILIVALVISVVYGKNFYLFTIRYMIEPDTDLTETNTDSISSLEEINDSLSKYLDEYDMDYTATEDNSYIIPGLEATRTLKNKKVSMCTSMTPQGICTTDQYVFISAYCHTHQHNSVIYMLNKKTHEFIKEIVVDGKYHLGNICYDTKHHTIWCAATGENPLTKSKCAYLNVLSLEDVINYDFNSDQKAISFIAKYPVVEFKNASFISYYKGNIFVGNYYEGIWKNSYVQRFPVNDEGLLDTTLKTGKFGKKEVVIGKEKAKISGLCQGIYFTDDYIALMQSSGTDDSTVRYFSDSDYKKDIDTMISLDALYDAYREKEQVVEDICCEFDTIKNDYQKAMQKKNKIKVDDQLNSIISSLCKLYAEEYLIMDQKQQLLSEEHTTAQIGEINKTLETIKDEIDQENDVLNEYKDQHKRLADDPDFQTANEILRQINRSLEAYESKISELKQAVDDLPDFDVEAYQKRIQETKAYDISDKKADVSMSFPPRLEQAMESSLDGSNVYLLFESAAYAYRAQTSQRMGRVIVITR